ncbi:MAG: YigZ family protein [Ruminococcaceae bacterium]|nr:YigZ family protein [Oscillospiraceae bacterium]
MTEETKAELYTTLAGEGSDEFEERRSIFIGHAKHVTSEEEAMEYVKAKKKEYSDATHNCWAYLLKGGIVARYSDDGEPQGTAGVPMLETIRKSGVCDCVVVVTRYFGGILLGAGGLVRAYSHGTKIALDAAEIVTYEKYTELRLDCSYSDYQKYSVILPTFNAIIDNTDFTDKVTVSFAVKETAVDALSQKITEMSGGRDKAERTGERFDYR